MDDIKKMFLENRAWSHEKKMQNENYYIEMAKDQSPKFLWIGCADSRVPPDVVTGTSPGEMFVQRNVANLVIHTDLNLMSVVEYAINVLKVKHIIVCGHYGCGGVKAAMSRQSLGIINKWLRNIKDVYRYHQEEVEACVSEDDKVNKLIELNVREQVYNLAKTSIVQKSWKKFNAPHLHGWVYDLHDGLLRPQIDLSPGDHLDHPIFEYDNLDD